MARTELPNGVILPAEYSDDWYEDMTSNLTKLDDVIGSDSEKLNSNDVAFLRMSSAALTDGGTGNFSDLNSSNKLKTGDYVLDSGRKLYQVVSVDSTNETFTVGNSLFKITAESDLAPVAESGDYDDLDNKPDLNPYDQHIVNTDIHVTTADKTKWNNGVSQAYVFRYSSTALVASSTNSNTLLDNTDNLKVGDKVIDSSGVLFSITAIDTVNSTFTVGSALIDLALDANVVHTNRNDDVSIPLNSTSAELGVTGGYTDITFLDKNNKKLSGLTLGNYASSKLSYARLSIFGKDTNDNDVQDNLEYAYVSNNSNAYLRVSRDNFCSLGSISARWKDVYAKSYYYGSDNVEFSTKFVTTDTAQTIKGNKTFGNGTLIVDNGIGSNVHGEIKLSGSRSGYIVADNSADGVFDSAGSGISILLQDAGKPLHIGGYKVDANGRVFADNTNKNPVLSITSGLIQTATLVPKDDTANSSFRILSQLNYANGNPSKTLDVRFIQYDNANATSAIYSNDDNKTTLGASSKKWKDCQTYLINGLTPSSLSLPDFSNRVDIAGYISNLSGSTNNYTPPVNGWLYVGSNDASYLALFDTGSGGCGIRFSDGVVGEKYACIPCQANRTLGIKITCTNLAHAYFVPCLGNI